MNHKLAWIALSVLGAWSCLYGFAGGGLPPQIHTVAILPFDNQTSQPALTQAVSDALREAVENRLGLRPAAEATADAVVRGAIIRYEPDIPVSFQAGQAGNVTVNKRRVQLTLNVEIYDQRQGRMLWQRSGLTVDGEYQPPQEAQGRQTALNKLVSDIVDGAQSQW
ncbi:MAG: hypothetical protein HY700_17390 [Gemmatimonadetes bacterium]|nr:hypothetical protein [Gemmatimonadota bacterium]